MSGKSTWAWVGAAVLAAEIATAGPRGTIKLPAEMDEHNFADAARVPMPVAVRRAMTKTHATPLWAGLENLDGFLYYGVELVAKDGAIASVTLDAGSGRIHAITSKTAAEAAADAAKEAAAEAAKARKDPKSEEARKAKQAAKDAAAPRAPAYRSSVQVPVKASPRDLASAAKLSMLDAFRAAAKDHPGKFSSASLVADRGNLLYAVTIKGADGKFTQVNVDAGNGAVLETMEGG